MAQIEYKGDREVNILYEYFTATGIPTGATKQNLPGDPDYIPPEHESSNCSVLYKYTNDQFSQQFIKNDCPAGQVGSAVVYTVLPGTYIADTQQEANDLAMLDIQLKGQDYANANGTCSLNPLPYKWIADESSKECEKTFDEDEVFTGLGSPWQPYLRQNDILYVDSSLNSIISIDPQNLTQSDIPDIISNAIQVPESPSGANSGNSVPTGLFYDSENDLIYVQGFFTQGCYVIDASTGIVQDLILDSISNGNFTRTRISGLKQIDKALLGSSAGKRINLITNEIDSSGISFMNGTTEAYINNNKVYAIRELSNQIRVYDIGITSNIATISNINTNTDEVGNYHMRGAYNETSTNRIYVGETSTTPAVRVIDTTTDTVSETVLIDKEGFPRGKIAIININTITGDIWICGGVGNGSTFSDYSPRIWVLDRNTLLVKDTLTFSQGVLVDSLIYHPQTNTVWVGSRGNMPYDGGSHTTDGVLFKFSSIGANTGNSIYKSLLKVSNDSNEFPLDANNVPTSISGLPQDSKLNNFGEEGYIPPFEDLLSCPV